MSTHDNNGRPWAKLSEVKAGDTLILDGDFSCHPMGPVEIMETDGDLFFNCNIGRHWLSSQIDDDGDRLIGLYKPETT